MSTADKTISTPTLSRGRRRLLMALGGLAAVIAAAAIVVLPRLSALTGGAPSIGGPFALTDQHGKAVTDATFRGKLMLVYFGYTFCPDVCPTTLGVIAQAMDKLSPAERAQVVPIFITVDPDRDSVKQMADYVVNFSPLLVGLTGTPEQIQKVEKEYRVYAKKAPVEGDPNNYGMDHSSILYVMGRDGRYLGHFAGNETAGDIDAGLRKFL